MYGGFKWLIVLYISTIRFAIFLVNSQSSISLQERIKRLLVISVGSFSRDVRDIQSEKSQIKKAKMLVKTPENEVKNVFVMKLNAQSLRICKLCIHQNRFIEESFKGA